MPWSDEFVLPREGMAGYAFLKCNNFYQQIEGGFGAGKSHLAVYKLLYEAWKTPGTYAFVRKAQTDVKKTIIPTFYDVLGYNAAQRTSEYVRAIGGEQPSKFVLRNGSEIWCLGLDSEALLGQQYRGICFSQAEQAPRDKLEILWQRIRKGVDTFCIMDVNPSFPNHILNTSDDVISRYKMKHWENPSWCDPITRVWTTRGTEEVTKLKRMTGVRYKRGWLALWVTPEGRVYESFDEDRHVDIRLDDVGFLKNIGARWFGAVDWGWNSPKVFLLIAAFVLGGQVVYVVHKEIYKTKLTRDRFRERMRNLCKRQGVWPEVIFADHEPEDNFRLEAEGFKVFNAKKDVVEGIDVCQELFENDRVLINPESLSHEPDAFLVDENRPYKFQQELLSYSYVAPDERKWNEQDEKPVKEFDHACDAFRYGMVGLETESEEWEPIAA